MKSSSTLPWLQTSNSTPSPAVPPPAVSPVVADALPAPVTTPTTIPSTGPAIVSTADIHSQAKTNGMKLAAALSSLGGPQTSTVDNSNNPTPATPDPILTGLSTLQANSDAATKSLVATTQAAYQNNVNKTNSQFENYKRGLQQLGIETGSAESTPDILSGHIQKAGNDQMEKISELSAEEAKTLMDAKNAQDTNDFKTLEDKMTYLEKIKTDKANAIKDMYDNISSASKTADIEAHDIYDTLDTLDPADKHAFIQAVAQKYNLPLASLVTSLADEKSKREVDAVDLQNKKRLVNGGDTNSTSKVQIAQGQNTLNTGMAPNGTKIGNPKGSDGFYDPSVYIKAFGEWPGSAKAFIAAYPIIGGINPESYDLLPASLQELIPKLDTSSSGQGS